MVDTLFEMPPAGGVQTFVKEILPGLRSTGVDASLVTETGPFEHESQRLESLGVPVYRRIYDRGRHLPNECAQRLAAFVNEHPGALYVIVNSPDIGWLALPWLNHNVPACAIAHNDVSAYYDPIRHYGGYLSDAAGVSSWIAQKVRSLTNGAAPPTWLPYGVRRIPRAGLANRQHRSELRVLYVGRLEQGQKRVDRLVKISEELLRLGVNFSLDVVGRGRDEETLRTGLARAGVDCRFHGWLSPDRVTQAFSSCDVLLLVSDHEGLPLVLLEAMACGVAPVAMDLRSGIRDLISHGINGFVVPQGDHCAVADVLSRMATAPQLLMALRTSAWESAATFSVDSMVEQYAAWTTKLQGAQAVRPPSPVEPMLSCTSRYPAWLRRLRLLQRRISAG